MDDPLPGETSNALPVQFEPLLKARVWGGNRLARFDLDVPVAGGIGEAWLLADIPTHSEPACSVVATGAHAGRTLRNLIESDRATWMGAASLDEEGRFPLLVKLLDARENLSVQVHPTAAYTRSHPGTHRKSEAWVVLDAEPGAVIYKGLRPGVTPERFRQQVEAGTADQALVAVPAVPGECHYLPSGTCHALGGGVLVAEVQTTSDTTFRLYDWGRTGRTLHVDEGLSCMSFEPGAPAIRHTVIDAGPMVTTLLVETPDFAIERIDARHASTLPLVTNGLPLIIIVLSGSVSTGPESGSLTERVAHGRSLLVPAHGAPALLHLEPDASVLRVTLPGPADRILDTAGTLA